MKIQDLTQEKIEATQGTSITLSFKQNGSPSWPQENREIRVGNITLVSNHKQQRYVHARIGGRICSLGGGTEISFQ